MGSGAQGSAKASPSRLAADLAASVEARQGQAEDGEQVGLPRGAEIKEERADHSSSGKVAEEAMPCLERNPLETAGVLSQLGFLWVTPLIRLGKTKQLEQEDLFPTHCRHTCQFLGSRVEDTWLPALKAAQGSGAELPRFWKHAVWPYSYEMVWVVLLMLVECAQQILSAVVLRELLLWLQDKGDRSKGRGYGLALGFGALGLLYPCLHHQYFNWSSLVGWNMRVQAMTLVNRKLLKLSGGSLAHITTGHCINLMSNDVRRFDELANFAPFIVLSPLQLVVVTVLIALELGVRPALAGVGSLLSLIPLQALFAHFFAKQRGRTVKYTDRRVKMTGEVLNGILAVKMFAWEQPFTEAIETIRRSERKNIRRASYINAFNESTFFCGAAAASFVTFATFHFLGGQLQPFKVFYVLALLQLPRLWMCAFFPMAIEKVAESVVSFRRLQQFLQLPELNLTSDSRPEPPEPLPGAPSSEAANLDAPAGSNALAQPGYRRAAPVGPHEPVVRVEEGAFSWSPARPPADAAPSRGLLGSLVGTARAAVGAKQEAEGEGKPSLQGVSFQLGCSELLGVTGKVGAGKSTLLAALLGDLHVLHGTLQVSATRIAYAAQKPFIVAGSLRDNILFGAPLDPTRYQQVLEVCALTRDIAQLPRGDETEIGERGINLSGGQKARVGLARAAYAESDLLLLDDPLSAVDPAVGRHLLERCILGWLAGRPRVLVTHQLQYLPKCDRVLLLSEGQVADIGTFNELQKRVDFHGFVDMAEDESEGLGSAPSEPGEVADKLGGAEPEKEEPRDAASVKEAVKGPVVRNSSILAEGGLGKGVQEGEREGTVEEEETNKASKGLVVSEHREEGNVAWRVYGGYAQKMGLAACGVLTLLLLLGQGAICMGDWFLAHWAAQDEQGGFWVYAYLGVVLSAITISFVRAGLFFVWAVAASSRIHSAMLASVLGSPLLFFHSNPVGRILNRFSADQGMMDDMLPLTLFNFLQMVGICLGAVVVVSAGVPWVTLGLIPVFVLFLHLRRVFLCTSRDLKRLEATARSPVYAHYAAAIQGLSTIRAFGAEAQFDAEFQRRLDANGQGYFAWLNSSRWLAFRLDTLCGVVLLASALLAVIARRQLSPGLVGLALTYILQLSGQFQWTVRQSAEVENLFTGVERALEYTRLPQEGLRVVPSNRPPPGWPQQGAIVLDHLSVRYRAELEPVLCDLTVVVEGRRKCGIVGRTGAGKSTLMLAIFRLVEPSEGRILIDGVDIATIGLEDLRRKVMAIPQDPVLFGNTLRFNLDPFSEYEDVRLWEALAAVQLQEKAAGLRGGLDTSMAEFGENFSVGERQLVCLARAILHHTRILIMDEATANVDLATDALIQQTLRDKFRDSTVLMIAHRMDTIIDADQVLVLDHGRVQEFGSPQKLLRDPGGAFSGMVRKTGAASEALLRQRVLQSST